MRPGWLANNALGDLREARIGLNPFTFGEWGRFHTFEPPQMDFTGLGAGSPACEGRLWCVQISDNPMVTDPYSA
jgi:hypothetical protein